MALTPALFGLEKAIAFFLRLVGRSYFPPLGVGAYPGSPRFDMVVERT